jgi:hypothetical protein
LGVVWVVEKPDLSATTSAASLLIGDFPVRCFASIRSFAKIAFVKKASLPKVIVLNIDCISQLEEESVLAVVEQRCPKAKLIVIDDSSGGKRLLSRYKNLDFFHSTKVIAENRFEFVRLIAQSVEVDKRQAAFSSKILTYKDLALDYDNHEFQIIPGGERENLPLKEARLLKFFIENSGRCVSREEIQDSVWAQTKVASRTIDSHISRLRKKISFGEVVIDSIYGGGYVLK